MYLVNRLVLLILFFLAACSPPNGRDVPDEVKEDSFFPYEQLEIDGVPINDYLRFRTVFILSGYELTDAGDPKRIKVGDRFTYSYVRASFAKDVTDHGLGSGVLISPDGYILTAAHVVDYAVSKILILPIRSTFKPATVVFLDRAADIAILHIDSSKMDYVPLANFNEIITGESVVCMGWSPNAELVYSPRPYAGKVIGFDDQTEKLPWSSVFIKMPFRGGDSGGPAILTNGKLVGILKGGELKLDIFLRVKVDHAIIRHYNAEVVTSLIEQDRQATKR